ncbi:MAG TPA: maleylpyruvate isomerase N-terminal domain-containing protein, partial [Acidimicrobiales bacterium]|nr:maleylpyruvate isomerase N-terminal domain-containing protein [Acidimicrobiales bacterium]
MRPDTALATATETFRSRLGVVTDAQLQTATPCEGWTVRDLIVHVIGGNNMAVALVEGCSADEARSFFALAAASVDLFGACSTSL